MRITEAQKEAARIGLLGRIAKEAACKSLARHVMSDSIVAYNNGKTNVVQRLVCGVVVDRYITQDFSQPRKGSGWTRRAFALFSQPSAGIVAPAPYVRPQISESDLMEWLAGVDSEPYAIPEASNLELIHYSKVAADADEVDFEMLRLIMKVGA
jgi:hypothetical protein